MVFSLFFFVILVRISRESHNVIFNSFDFVFEFFFGIQFGNVILEHILNFLRKNIIKLLE